jgi:hypothetical protein
VLGSPSTPEFEFKGNQTTHITRNRIEKWSNQPQAFGGGSTVQMAEIYSIELFVILWFYNDLLFLFLFFSKHLGKHL